MISSILFGYLLISIYSKDVLGGELIYDRIELLNGSYLEGVYNYSAHRISKFNRTAYALNTNFELFVDISDDFKFEGIFYFNRLNNNQYTKSFIHIPRDTLCNTCEKFKLLLPPSNLEISNYIGSDIDYCPIRKGKYYAKNHAFSKHLPPVFQPGHWKFELMLFHGVEQIWGIRLYFKVDSRLGVFGLK